MIDQFVQGINDFARYIIPLLLVGIPFYGLVFKKIKVYELFVEGAKAVSYTHLTLPTNREV